MLYLGTDFNMPVEYCTSGKFICKAGGAVHPDRKLNTFVLLFGCEGEYCIEQNGVEYRLGPGDFLILLEGCRHRGTSACGPGLSHYWCHFTFPGGYELVSEENVREQIDTAFSECERNLKDTSNFSGIERRSRLLLPEYGHVAYPEKYRLLFHSLIDQSRSMHAFRSRVCDLILMQLLYELSGEYLQQLENSDRWKQQALVEKIVEYIRIHAMDLKSVQQVADHFGYNPEYLTTIVKKSTGMSMMLHINRSKIEEAKKLLLSTNLTISEIAPLCGFGDVKYFSKLFHKITDTTPSQYRNMYCRIHMNR